MTADKIDDRRLRYEQRMIDAGFVRVGLWVPESGKQSIKAEAEKMREAHLRKAPLRDTV